MNFWDWNILKPFKLASQLTSPDSKIKENSMDTANETNDSRSGDSETVTEIENFDSGSAKTEGNPSAVTQAELKNAMELMLLFQTCYKLGIPDCHIPFLLDHWVFFALFILHIPDHLSQLSKDFFFNGKNIPVLTEYLPRSAKTADGKKQFVKNMQFFRDICIGENNSFTIQPKTNFPGRLALVYKPVGAEKAYDEWDQHQVLSTGGESTGFSFLLTSQQLAKFASKSAQKLRCCILLQKPRQWGLENKMYLVAGPIVFLSHCCSVGTEINWSDKSRVKFLTTVTPTVPNSSPAVYLRSCLSSHRNMFGEGIVTFKDSPWIKSECQCEKCDPQAGENRPASVKELGDAGNIKKPAAICDSSDAETGGMTTTARAAMASMAKQPSSFTSSSNDTETETGGSRYKDTGDFQLFGDEPFPRALEIIDTVFGIVPSTRFPRRKVTSSDIRTLEECIERRDTLKKQGHDTPIVVDPEFQNQQDKLREILQLMNSAKEIADGDDAKIRFPTNLITTDFLFVCHRSYGIPGQSFPTCALNETNEADVVVMESKIKEISSDDSKDAEELRAFVKQLRSLLPRPIQLTTTSPVQNPRPADVVCKTPTSSPHRQGNSRALYIPLVIICCTFSLC